MKPKPSHKNEDDETPDPHSFNSLLFDSSIHGVKYLSQTDRPVWERVLWLIIIGASSIGAAFFVYGVLHQYYQSPVIVSFQTAQTSVARIPYPAVTICSINRFRKSGFLKLLRDVKKMQEDKDRAEKAKDQKALEKIWPELIMTMKVLRTFDHMCETTNSFHAHFNYSLNETTTNLKDRGIDLEYDMKITFIDTVNEDFKTMWKKYAEQSCSEMIPLCLWEGEAIDCSTSFLPRYTRYGACCTFNMIPQRFYSKNPINSLINSGNLTQEQKDWVSFDIDKHIVIDAKDETENKRRFPRRQTKAGQGSGLSFLLNPELGEYHCGGNSGFGFRMLAHTPIEEPKVKDFGLALGPGREVFMNVQADLTIADESIKDLSPDSRYCYFSHEQPLDLYTIYTQNNCIDECISNLVLANCSCIRIDLPSPKFDPFLALCEGKSLACSERIRAYIMQLAGDIDEVNSTYCKDCYPSCNRIEYRVQSSTLRIRADPQIWMDKDNNKPSWANENVSIVHVYFGSDSVYSRVRKKQYGTNDLIANIGGILGLFLGMSIMGIIEPVWYILKLTYFKISKRGSPNKSFNVNLGISHRTVGKFRIL